MVGAGQDGTGFFRGYRYIRLPGGDGQLGLERIAVLGMAMIER